MKYASCHTDRKHYAKGMCNPCWQKSRSDPEKKRIDAKQYHQKHRNEILAKQKLYYKLNADRLRAKRRARYVGHPRPIKPIEDRKRVLSKKPKSKPITFERPPAPIVIAPNDRDWWKLTEKPRHWL